MEIIEIIQSADRGISLIILAAIIIGFIRGDIVARKTHNEFMELLNSIIKKEEEEK